jgi:7-carboxy-7-deazaguanine synthase
MFGRNPKRPPVKGDGQTLAVQEIFPTIQGEGPFAGYPSVFIRLGGCNLACSFCDTEFESFRDMSLEAIMEQVRGAVATPTPPLAVITGGEPMRQPIGRLSDALLAEGFAVQVETNGTLFQPLDARVSIVCSPKAANGFYGILRPDVLARASALKFLISAACPPYTTVPDMGQHQVPVYLQPMDEMDAAKNAANLAHTLHLVQTTGCRLSMQLHKIIGIR